MSFERTIGGVLTFCPISLDLRGKNLLIVGGGKLALRELNRLIEFGALIDIVAPRLISEMQETVQIGGKNFRFNARSFSEQEIEAIKNKTYVLVLAVSDNQIENDAAICAAKEFGCPVYDGIAVEKSDFLVPALLKRGHLKIAVSTDGISHALEKSLLRRIEAALQPELDKYHVFLNTMAERLAIISNSKEIDKQARAQIQNNLENSEELWNAVERHKFDEAQAIIDRVCEESSTVVGT
jgi:precorrin-2 dehydrogenase / sirohydrochlorin ferrochelatase